MKSFTWFAVLAALGAAHVALADNSPNLKPFSMRLELPSDSASCGDRASSLGSVFAAQTGLTVTAANCVGSHSILEDGTTYETVTLIIDYMAPAEVLPYQALFGGMTVLGSTVDHSALFAKYGACLHARGAQEAAFSANTGLQVFASYCDVSNDPSSPGYTLVVEGFGTPRASLYAFMQDGAFDSYSSKVMQAAVSVINQAGGTIVLNDSAHIFYYSPEALTLEATDLGTFANSADCFTQLAAARKIYASAEYPNDPAANATALCDGSSKGATLTVVSANIPNVGNDNGISSPQYSSFDECMADLNRVIQNATSNGDHVFGGICAPNTEGLNGTFVVDLYSSEY